MRTTLVFRLTLLYGGLFLLFSIGVYFWATHAFSQFYLQHLDERLHEEIVELQEEYAEEGIEELREFFQEEGEKHGKLNAFYRLIRSDQRSQVSSDLTAWPNLTFPQSELENMHPGEKKWSSIELPNRESPVRVLTLKMPDGNILQGGIEMGEGGRLMILFERVLLVLLSATLILGIFAGGWIVHRAMRGVRQVTKIALQIGENNLDSRVPLENKGEEIDQLAIAFNSMLNRISSLIQGLKEVSDNIAHDLKRPVTRIRGIAESFLTQPETLSDKSEATGIIIEECDRLMGTVNTMLEIARLDSTGHVDPRETIDLTVLCRNAVELFEPFAEDKGLKIALDVPESPVLLEGNPTQLQRALANLLDNAILYSDHGTITVSVSLLDKARIICVDDEGPGITQETQSRIFERFFRGDPSRSEVGTGLGLNLVKSIVHAHRGRVELESEPGKGSRFTLVFPHPHISIKNSH